MADPLSLVASITGVLAFAAATARTLATLVQDIRDAPEDVLATGRDVRSLAAVLAAAHDTCARHDLATEDKHLAAALAEYVDMCQEAMHGLRSVLRPLSAGARPVRFMLTWTMRKGEVRALRARLNEGKASLNLTLSALNGVLEGKGQEDIRADIGRVFGQMMNEFRNLEAGRKVRKRIEDDVVSVSASRARRSSMSETTDTAFAMRRFLQPGDTGNAEDGLAIDNTTENVSFLSPWTSDPNAILEAVRCQNTHLINTLLAQSVSLSPRSPHGYTVLHYCAIADDAETAALLLEHGADVNAKDYELRSPFRVALASEALSVARLLAERGCAVGDLSPVLMPLMARTEEISGVQPLLATLAKRLNQTSQGPYLIHEAITQNQHDSLKMLLEAGFSVAKADQNGLSPFHHALRSQKKPMMKLLIEHGTDINEGLPRAVLETLGVPSSWHLTTLAAGEPSFAPLVLAARYMRSESLTRFLLDNGTNPNQPIGANRGSVVLVGVCAHEYMAQAKALLQAGANPNHVPPDGRGPMYWASVCQNSELMACMLSRGGDFNYQRAQDGSTPLSIAASKGNITMVRMLLKAGADPSRRNKDGKSALDLARSGGKRDVVSLLEEALRDM